MERVLADFRGWLSALQAAPPVPLAPPTVDLFTLVAQFTALRHDVTLQTKATRAAVERLSAVEPDDATRPLLKALVEVYDALALGEAQAVRTAEQIEKLALTPVTDSVHADPSAKPGFWQRLFARPAPAWAAKVEKSAAAYQAISDRLTGLADGYMLGLRRLDRVLSEHGLTPIESVGRPFDPDTMEAVELADGPPNTVVEEVRRGYRRNGKVFRPAQVKVAR